MLQYPLLIPFPKASDYLYNKEEIYIHNNLVTESKVTECNSNCYAEISVTASTGGKDGTTPYIFYRACVRDA